MRQQSSKQSRKKGRTHFKNVEKNGKKREIKIMKNRNVKNKYYRIEVETYKE